MEQERPTKELRREEADRLRNEAAHMEADVQLYVQSTPRERRIIKMNSIRSLKKRAREHGFDPEEFVDWTPEKRSDEIERVTAARVAEAEANLEDDEKDVSYSEGMEVPPNDLDPRRRNGVSFGPIVPEDGIEDLVGDQPPLNLADLYARWPVGRPGGDDFYIRVDRIQPKKYQDVNCAGFLAKVRRLMTDEQFAKWFGGREYHLTVYGPHPRGRRDANGDIIIKRLTAPIHVVVPHVAPNLDVMPALAPSQQETVMYQDHQNPFATVMPRAPMTSADANIHASSLRFFETVMKQNTEELREARRNQQSGNGDPTRLLGFATDMAKTTAEAMKEDAQRREEILREQLREEREERKEQERELRELKQRMEQLGVSRAEGSLELLKFGDAASQRHGEHYRQQLENLQRSNDEQMKLLRQTHDDELKRERERLRDLEEYFKRAAEEERRSATEREKLLKEEVDRIRREERDNADRRVGEVEKSAQRRYEDLESAHSRELRTMKDNMDVKATAERNRLEFELSTMRDRLEEAKTEVVRVREDSDPIKALEKYKEGAKAFGLVEKDADAPSSVWERFAQAAGGGVGQFLANADIGAIMSAVGGGSRTQAPVGNRPQGRPQQLPPGQRTVAPQRQQTDPQRRSRAQTWASQGSPVAKQHQVVPPGSAHGPQRSPEPTQVPSEPSQPPQSPQPPAQTTQSQPPQQPPQAQQANASQVKLPPGKFHEIFNDQAIFVFLNRMEGAINMGFAPEKFAESFYSQFPAESLQLAHRFTAQDAIEYMQQLVKVAPQAAGSPILRRDGRKWLEKMWPAILQVAESSAGPPAETELPT